MALRKYESRITRREGTLRSYDSRISPLATGATSSEEDATDIPGDAESKAAENRSGFSYV
jgi:hypothetical protein